MFIKRLMDLVLSLIAIIVLAPVFLLIGFLIRVDSPGPAIFKQIRVGKNGKFIFYKFRTMIHNAPQDVFEDFILRALQNEYGDNRIMRNHIAFKTKDKRLTRFGCILRRTTLDELPQLWNIIKGDMTLVGPRPDVPFAVDKYTSYQKRRLEVKPGLTCLWVVSGRSYLTLQQMFEKDIEYIKRQSLSLDIKMLFKTILTVIKVKGAG